MAIDLENTDRPDIFSVVAMTDEAIIAFKKLYDEDTERLSVPKLNAILQNGDIKKYGMLTEPNNPMLVGDPENGPVTMYQVFIAPIGERKPGYEHIPSPDYTVVLISQMEEGSGVFKPQMLLRGKEADVVVVGGMTCCGKIGVQTHWTQDMGDGRIIDEARIPLEGLAHDEHAFWLKDKVHVAPGDVLIHILQHALAHRFPDNPKYNHDCHSERDIGAYMAELGHPSP